MPSLLLPVELHNGTRQNLIDQGVSFGEVVNDIFVRAEVPDGWGIRVYEPEWSELEDDKGRTRLSIYTRTNFFEKRSFGILRHRFSIVNVRSCTKRGEPIDICYSTTHLLVSIADAGRYIHDVGFCEISANDKLCDLEAMAEAWLDEKYPDWRVPSAYWGVP